MGQNFLDRFILVEYNGLKYPEGYSAQMHEVAAHFDKKSISPEGTYSLHTEYSYRQRNFDSELISRFTTLRESHKNHVPQLWKSEVWAQEFADYIISLTRGHAAPSVIEIHPPFNDYCSLDGFSERYRVFEERIHSVHPETIIVIENRAGTVYRGGRFLVGTATEIASLCEIIMQNDLKLGVVLDFPQLLTAENIDPLRFKVEKYQAAIDTILPYHDLIKGIHIWGKKKSAKGRWVAHSGNFDTYFSDSIVAKKAFLSGIHKICSDGISRFLVPEINSGTEDLLSIIHDLFSEPPYFLV